LNDCSSINQTCNYEGYWPLLDQGSWRWWGVSILFCCWKPSFIMLLIFGQSAVRTHERDKSNDPENMRICL